MRHYLQLKCIFQNFISLIAQQTGQKFCLWFDRKDESPSFLKIASIQKWNDDEDHCKKNRERDESYHQIFHF